MRDFFHYCDNYIDAMDRAAEKFATESVAGERVQIETIRTSTDQDGNDARLLPGNYGVLSWAQKQVDSAVPQIERVLV